MSKPNKYSDLLFDLIGKIILIDKPVTTEKVWSVINFLRAIPGVYFNDWTDEDVQMVVNRSLTHEAVGLLIYPSDRTICYDYTLDLSLWDELYNEVIPYSQLISDNIGLDDVFEPLNESTRREWAIEDLKTLHDKGIILYEVDNNTPVKNDGISHDDIANVFYIGNQDGRYRVCYKLNSEGMNGVEECLSTSERSIVNWLNLGVLKPAHDVINLDVSIDDAFEPLNESEEGYIHRFKEGDVVMVNGYYNSDTTKLDFHNDVGIVGEIIHNKNFSSPWYLIKFSNRRIKHDNRYQDTFYLLDGKHDGGSFNSDIIFSQESGISFDDVFGELT